MDDEARLAAGERRVLGAEAADRAAPRDDEELRRARGELDRAPDDPFDRLVAQVDDILGGPVVPVARRVVERALEVRIRGPAEEVGVRAELADRARARVRHRPDLPPTCR